MMVLVIALFAVILGVFCSLIFQGVLRTPPMSKPSKILFTGKTRTWPKICRICRNPKLHLVAFVHTSSRVFHSLNLVYMPFYINETNVREAGIIAMAPFFSFIGSLVASLVITYTSKVYTNNKILFTIGTMFALLSSACVYLNPDQSQDPTLIYAASVLYGIGSAMTIVKSLCIAANFIGNNTDDGAFIYGLITFCDKILNGVIIFIIEYFKCLGVIDYHHYYKFVLTFFSGIVTIAGFIFLQLLPSSICYSD